MIPTTTKTKAAVPWTSAQIQARIAALGVTIGRFERDTSKIDPEDLEEWRNAVTERALLRARLPIVAERERQAADESRKPKLEAARVAAALATREAVFRPFIVGIADHLEAIVAAAAERGPELEAELERRADEAARLAREAGITFSGEPKGDVLRQWVREEIAKKHQAAISAAALPGPVADLLPALQGWRRWGT